MGVGGKMYGIVEHMGKEHADEQKYEYVSFENYLQALQVARELFIEKRGTPPKQMNMTWVDHDSIHYPPGKYHIVIFPMGVADIDTKISVLW
jgi:hypothetical protein